MLERAVTLRNMLKNPDRVGKVAAYVAEHFTETHRADGVQGVPGRRRPGGVLPSTKRRWTSTCRRSTRRSCTRRRTTTTRDGPLPPLRRRRNRQSARRSASPTN